MTKKSLLIIISIFLSFLLVSCGKTNTNNETITLLVDLHGWSPTLNTEPTLENPKVVQTPQLIANEFMKQNPNIKIKWVRNKNVSALEEEMSQWFTTQIETNNCPTIAYSWGTKYQYNDWYVDLTNYLEEPNPYVEGNKKWADLFEEYLFNQTDIRGMDGNIYAIPIFLFAGPATGWYYNKTVFEEENITVPSSWKEFLDVVNALKLSDFGQNGTVAAPWSYFNAVQLDQWVMLASLGPSFASYIFDETDYDHDGCVTEVEQVRATLEGYYSPVNNQYAKDLYFELKKYYTQVLEPGWLTTDYYTAWQNGNVAMKEDGTWRMIDENNARNRNFESDVFPSPIIGKDSYSYLPEIDPQNVKLSWFQDDNFMTLLFKQVIK